MRAIPGLVAVDQSLDAFLAANTHAFARSELLSQWSRTALENAVRAARAIRILPGIYSGTEHQLHPVVKAEAATLWAPRALLTGALALHVYCPALPPPRHVDLATANGDTLHAPGWIRVHQTRRLPPYGLPGGIRCVPPARALLDAWRFSPPLERRSLLWEALWARACTYRQVARELERAPRVAGRRDLERVLGWFAEGATSPLEVRAKHETFADARFREFEWQVPLMLPSRRATPDMLHRRAMVAVELDGDRYHSTRAARDADRDRQTDLTAAGYAVLRFGWRDVVDRPQWCRDRVLTTVAGRLAAPSRSSVPRIDRNGH